jgi:glycosyltransferase involved in cell wall biosynthesis
LHVWDVAGVANIIAKFMDKTCGTQSYVIARKAFDPFGLNLYSKPIDSGAKMFVFRALLKARRYDIIHVHTLDKIVPHLKLLYKKPVVLGYNGSDIRYKWNARRKFWSKADLVTYSTLELATAETPLEALWIPCPIDTELFFPQPNRKVVGTALSFEYRANDLAKEYAEKHGLLLTIKQRDVPYLSMPTLLANYEFYIDVKKDTDGKVSEALSKTGLEALACGCKVIRWDGQIMSGLPEEHRAENVARKLYGIYQSFLKRS